MSKVIRRGQTLVILGISGCGKGTFVGFMKKEYPELHTMSTGDGLRHIMQRENLVGRYIGDILRRGDLVPHWAAAYIWLTKFIETLKGDEMLIIDGAPRRIEEAKLLDTFMGDIGRKLPVAILVDVPEKIARERLSRRGRSDDNVAAIEKRFQFFKVYVSKVFGYYTRQGRLIRIDGTKSPEEVWREAHKKLKHLLRA